jgi:hypothetical protein
LVEEIFYGRVELFFFRFHLSSQKRLPIFRLHTRISLKKISVWHGFSRSSLRIRSWSCAKRALNRV